MDTIGINRPVIIPVPTVQTTAKSSSADTFSLPGSTRANSDQIPYDAHGAEQARVDTVKRAAEQIANNYVLGDKTFAIFKDATGQYITRFTNLRDGKVTYIPEPNLLHLGLTVGGSEPVVKIKA